ncbi:hypothetical protein D3227_27270 [Mesorhizobium waimense]|uniref:Uncharacterized protein n=1 Tax=Mesorhizobium waimense TaxID=1300307 RepID=A0A3A5KAV8_9HYPH|nr:hypothetical protein [Mesorhizobium waimense]RJT32104.1 hypothetical protein D3227_27270 [Mesorhizobium waimense]
MGSRGRKSAEALTVVTLANRIAPDAPYHLTDAQAAIWRGIVDTLPAEFFPSESFDTLAAYCRHACEVRRLSGEVERFKTEWLRDGEGLRRYGVLIKLRELEVRSMLAAARSLRLTNQSRYRADSAATRSKPLTRPWL